MDTSAFVLGMFWQRDDNLQTVSRLTRSRELAAVRLNNGLGDGQSQP